MTADPLALARRLGPAERLLVVVDHDGTLSPIAPDPDAAVLAPGAAEAIERLAARAPVAVVSGRGLDDLIARLGALPVTIGANHGGTLRRPDGTTRWLVDAEAVEGDLDALVERLDAILPTDAGWLVERKDLSVSVHHRLVAPGAVERHLPVVRSAMEAIAGERDGLAVLEGRAVLELRPLAADKGRALRELAAAAPGRVPLAIGDDVTDEDLFAAAIALGGHAVLVEGAGRASLASDRLADPAAVVALLEALAADPDRSED